MSKRYKETKSFYHDGEPFNPPQNRPFYWDDWVEVWNRWNAGDLCPLSINGKLKRLETVVLPVYEKYSKGKLPGKSHKKKKVTTPVLAPGRRSKRHDDVDIVEGGIVAEPSMC